MGKQFKKFSKLKEHVKNQFDTSDWDDHDIDREIKKLLDKVQKQQEQQHDEDTGDEV